MLLAGAFSVAQATEVAYEVAGVHDRKTKLNGSEVKISAAQNHLKVALDSRNINNVNKTVVSAGVVGDLWGFEANAGLGETFETNARTHAVYFGDIAYTYKFDSRWSATADVGYQNDFQRNILDRQVNFGLRGAYAYSDKVSFGAGFTRINGDTKINSIALTCNTKF